MKRLLAMLLAFTDDFPLFLISETAVSIMSFLVTFIFGGIIFSFVYHTLYIICYFITFK